MELKLSENQVVAIDGTSASGKTTLAKRLASELKFLFVGTGMMYRAVTWKILKMASTSMIEEEIQKIFSHLKLSLQSNSSEILLLCNGFSYKEEELKNDEINFLVSKISTFPFIRETLVSLQRECIQKSSIVMEGRDIGSVVFPDTPYKIYVDANEEIRLKRRKKEGSGENLKQRDKIDSERKFSPLKISNNAEIIDSSYMNEEQVFVRAKEILQKKGLKVN